MKDIAADEDVSEKESKIIFTLKTRHRTRASTNRLLVKNAQLQEINNLLEEHNLLGDDVKVDDQVKMYTG